MKKYFLFTVLVFIALIGSAQNKIKSYYTYYLGEVSYINNKDNNIKTYDKNYQTVYVDKKMIANGYGKEFWKKKDKLKYEGEWKDGMKHGKGTSYSGGGHVEYEGEWKENTYHGKGTLYHYNGKNSYDKFEGEFINGKATNHGTMIWSDGFKYEGDWKDSDKFCYWNNKQRHGSGVMYYPDGAKYEGQWEVNDRTGFGIMYYASGAKYKGQWHRGLRHGSGVYTASDGAIFKGEWGADVMWGQGTADYADGSKYVGHWNNGKRDGQGTYTYADGGKYEGYWNEGKRDGQGTLYYADGKVRYTGQWKNDQYHGQGTYTWKDGLIFKGEFSENKRNGYGTLYYTDGTSKSGTWSNDKLESDNNYVASDKGRIDPETSTKKTNEVSTSTTSTGGSVGLPGCNMCFGTGYTQQLNILTGLFENKPCMKCIIAHQVINGTAPVVVPQGGNNGGNVGGSSSNSSSGNYGPRKRVESYGDCSFCLGTGRCKTCNGNGYYPYSFGSGNINCPNCKIPGNSSRRGNGVCAHCENGKVKKHHYE